MSDTRVRRVREPDVPAVLGLVHDLAEYERLRHECRMTEEQLTAALFGPNPAVFGHVAEVDRHVVGFTLWFLNFSTFHGTQGIYLEDLFVRPEYRGDGVGRALLEELAAECVRRGYARLEWSVLNWNEPAIGFYRSLGAVPADEWTTYRLTGDALAVLGLKGRRANPTGRPAEGAGRATGGTTRPR